MPEVVRVASANRRRHSSSRRRDDISMTSRKRRSRRRSLDLVEHKAPLSIRVGNRRAPGNFEEVMASSARDSTLFEDTVRRSIKDNPGEPLLLIINGHRSWLSYLLGACIREKLLPDIVERNKEVQYTDAFRFPERMVEHGPTTVPWSFICDQMNVPETYWWSFKMSPPPDADLFNIDEYRLRTGVWTCAEGAVLPQESHLTDESDDYAAELIPITILFTKHNFIAEAHLTRFLFSRLYTDQFSMIMSDETEGICWLFHRLWHLLSDWENIEAQLEERLETAELNSRAREGPASIRTSAMHDELARIYNAQQYLRFHCRAFSKLLKYKEAIKEREREKKARRQHQHGVAYTESIELRISIAKPDHTADMTDAIDDLEQAGYELDLLIDRFKNLTEYEFNMENAKQAEDTRFLSIVATLFLPLSFLASIWGMTEFTGSPMLYLYIAIPLLGVSVGFAWLFPTTMRKIKEVWFKEKMKRPKTQRERVRLLGNELPGGASLGS
ncbi:hypothetical protein K402DRAFT_42974 [Aulographum hederae CBS 113979]|uniref:Cora-domain-containing protein n=1 Tax=Aulographum hederae CBS 113979 TaxID=1176131 RepID=A0A6G1H339_9PEZI|nr:hypothetical protein K402DRAFT_42974 [Aulographum hederae CBS 113979]